MDLILTHCQTFLLSIHRERELQDRIPNIGQMLIAMRKAFTRMGLYGLPRKLLIFEAISNEVLDLLYSINL